MTSPYKDCGSCIAKNFCKIYSGEVKPKQKSAWCHPKFYLYKALELSRIPQEYLNANIYNFSVNRYNKSVFKTLEEYVNHIDESVREGVNFIFFGRRPGTGKTYSASVLLNHFIYKALNRFDFETPPALFISYPELIDALRYNKNEMEDLMGMIKSTSLLLLDDVGAGTSTEYAIEQTYILINHRYAHKKSTIITSNLSIAELSDTLGDRIVSRILARSVSVEITGRDRRLGLDS